MLRVGRSMFTPSHRVRFLSWLASWVSGGLLAAACANAGGSEWIAQNLSQTRSDSTASPAPAIAAPSAGTKGQKRANYSLHLHGGLFAPIDVNATSPTIGLRFARVVAPHLQGGL